MFGRSPLTCVAAGLLVSGSPLFGYCAEPRSFYAQSALSSPYAAQAPRPEQSDVPAVALVYLIPPDRQKVPGFERALQNALVHLQHWYANQMGGRKSFVIATPAVRTVAAEHPSGWYATHPNGPDRKEWFISNVAAEGFRVTGGSYGSRKVVSIAYIDAEMAEGQHGGAGSAGHAVLHRLDIRGLMGKENTPVCRWVGGLGHELGHALGRRHPPECDGPRANGKSPGCASMMFTGMYKYPRTSFLEGDRLAFDESPFFAHLKFSGASFDCAAINKLPLQVPGLPFPVCNLMAVGSAPPSHVCYVGQDGKTAIHGMFKKVGANRWHESNSQSAFEWTVVAESAGQILLFDSSRNLNFEIDLQQRQMRWRVGNSGPWVQSHKVTGHD